METDSSQWCPPTRHEAMGKKKTLTKQTIKFNLNIRKTFFFFFYCEDGKTLEAFKT